MPHEWLTRDEAAQYLRLKKRTMDAWATKGIGPQYCKIGGKILYSKVELDQWIAEHRVTRERVAL